jgi:hypothetical protein
LYGGSLYTDEPIFPEYPPTGNQNTLSMHGQYYQVQDKDGKKGYYKLSRPPSIIIL